MAEHHCMFNMTQKTNAKRPVIKYEINTEHPRINHEDKAVAKSVMRFRS